MGAIKPSPFSSSTNSPHIPRSPTSHLQYHFLNNIIILNIFKRRSKYLYDSPLPSPSNRRTQSSLSPIRPRSLPPTSRGKSSFNLPILGVDRKSFEFTPENIEELNLNSKTNTITKFKRKNVNKNSK